MSSSIPQAHFDRGKPFYPIIMQYLIQLIGVKDLPIQAIIGPRDVDSAIAKIVNPNSPQWAETADIRLKLTKLLGPLELASSVQSTPLTVPIDDIAKEVESRAKYLLPYTLLSAGTLLILAHELCKDKAVHDTGPLWEFLRHCRNGAAHGGKFNLRNGEPRRPAKWKSLEIQPNLNGTPLFKEPSGIGLLGLADPIFLLWDIEQEYPSLSV